MGDELDQEYLKDNPDYCNCTLHDIPIFTMALGGRKAIVEGVISDILKGNTEQVNSSLFNMYNDNYTKAVEGVFGSLNTSDKVRAFKLNAAKMAAAKSYQITGKLQQLKKDRSSSGFMMDSKKLIDKYNRYQSVEYNTLMHRARVAKQFETFLTQIDLYPNLTWIRSRSANPREQHLAYVGITLPSNHPFWVNNQPGNLWECKCSWKTSDGPVTAPPRTITPPARGLEGNPYYSGELVTKNHSYFKNAPKWIDDNAMLQVPDDLAFKQVETQSGNLMEHELVEKEQEAATNREISKVLLQNGFKDIKLLPRIHASEIALRDRYYGSLYNTEHPTSCPDAILDGKVAEFKETNFTAAGLRIKKAAEKSDIVVLEIKKVLTEETIISFVKGQFAIADRENLKEIIIVNNDKVYRYKNTSATN